MNTNFKVVGLTRLGIKPESTVLEADALTIWPSEQATAVGTVVCIMHAAHALRLVTRDAFSIIKNKIHSLNHRRHQKISKRSVLMISLYYFLQSTSWSSTMW